MDEAMLISRCPGDTLLKQQRSLTRHTGLEALWIIIGYEKHPILVNHDMTTAIPSFVCRLTRWRYWHGMLWQGISWWHWIIF